MIFPSKIDPKIKPIIRLLNRKGYKTTASCTGHPLSTPRLQRLKKKMYLYFKKKHPKVKKSEFYSSGDLSEGYIAFQDKTSPKIIKEKLKGTKIYKKLYLDNVYHILEFKSRNMKQKDIDDYWKEAYGVLMERL